MDITGIKPSVPRWLQTWASGVPAANAQIRTWKNKLQELQAQLVTLALDAHDHTVPEALALIYQPHAQPGVQLQPKHGSIEKTFTLMADGSVALKEFLPYLAANTRLRLGEDFDAFLSPLNLFLGSPADAKLLALSPPATQYTVPADLSAGIKTPVTFNAETGEWQTPRGPSSTSAAARRSWETSVAAAKATRPVIQGRNWREAVSRDVLAQIEAEFAAHMQEADRLARERCQRESEQQKAALFFQSLFRQTGPLEPQTDPLTPLYIALLAVLDASGIDLSPILKRFVAETLTRTCFDGTLPTSGCLSRLVTAFNAHDRSIVNKLKRIGFNFP